MAIKCQKLGQVDNATTSRPELEAGNTQTPITLVAILRSPAVHPSTLRRLGWTHSYAWRTHPLSCVAYPPPCDLDVCLCTEMQCPHPSSSSDSADTHSPASAKCTSCIGLGAWAMPAEHCPCPALRHPAKYVHQRQDRWLLHSDDLTWLADSDTP